MPRSADSLFGSTATAEDNSFSSVDPTNATAFPTVYSTHNENYYTHHSRRISISVCTLGGC